MKLTNKQIEKGLRDMLPFPVTIEGVEHMEEMLKNIGDPDINCLNEMRDNVFNRLQKSPANTTYRLKLTL